ncbi:MAG: PAS domain-containing protein [Zetaproteobacteria bacterium]|nr:PAS domain-containing protein [Zetaproteobacteria bacterium]
MLDANGFKICHETETATENCEIIQRLCCLLWAALEENTALMWRNSVTNEILAINSFFTELLGWELEDQIGKIPYEDWVHPDDVAMVRIIGETNSSVPYSARVAQKGGGFKRVFIQSVSVVVEGINHRVTILRDE